MCYPTWRSLIQFFTGNNRMRGVGAGARLLLQAGKHTLKAAGKGAKSGVEAAVKNVAREETARFLRGRLARGANVLGASAAPGFSVAPISIRDLEPPQLYPTFCECEENPRGLVTPRGKLLKCTGCAPKGMPAADYRLMLEARAARLLVPRVRSPAHSRRGSRSRGSRSRTPGGTRRSSKNRARSSTP